MPQDSAKEAAKWLDRISAAQARDKSWIKRGEKVVARYRDDREKSNVGQSKYNILFSNTETIKPLLYSRTPNPDIRRRFSDRGPIARNTAELLERLVSFFTDSQDFDCVIEDTVQDYLLPGRGTVRVKYKPVFEEVKLDIIEEVDPQTGKVLSTEEQSEERLVSEQMDMEYVYWKDFTHSDAKRWEDVTWVAFRGLMTKSEVEEMFPGFEDLVQFDADIKDGKDTTRQKSNLRDKFAIVWEIWDKENKEVLFVAENFAQEVLDRIDDPLNLSGFYPCPKPLYSITTNDTLEPVPFFAQYQDQATELDRITDRINKLIEELKRRGVYDASMKEKLSMVLAGTDNSFQPVDDYAKLAERGGIGAVVGTLPIDDILQVVVSLYAERQQLLNAIQDIVGISDILRAKTDAREAAATNQLKANFGTLRISSQQRQVERFIRDIYRLATEAAAQKFEISTLERITGIPVSDPMIALLRNRAPLSFNVDVETDSTVEADQQMMRQQSLELVEAITSFAERAPGLVQVFGFEFTKEIFMSTFRAFKRGRHLEDMLDDALAQKVEELQQQEGEEQAPDPELIRAQNEQVELEMRQAEMLINNEIELAKLRLQDRELSLKEAELGVKANVENEKLDLKAAETAIKANATRIEGENPNINVVAGA